MSPGFGDKLKKLAKGVNDAGRLISDADAVLHGRTPSSSSHPSTAPGGPASQSSTAPPTPANARCSYCGGLVARGTPKCPNCNAPL